MKPKPLIPEQSYRSFQRDALRKHFDAADTMFLERELTQLRARLFETVFPELIARSLMPFANDIAPSAETYSYKVLKAVGAVKVVAHNAKDLPRIDAVAREVVGKVHTLGGSYGWDINELREAARLKIPLSDVKARTTRDAMERGIDEMLAFGDLSESAGQTGLQLLGVLNNTDVTGEGIQAGAFWLNSTPPDPKDVLDDLNILARSVSVRTKERFAVNTILLPTAHFHYAEQTPYSTLNGASILSVFLNNNKNVKTVRPWYRLDTAGAANAPRGVAYQADPMVLEGIVPQEFEQLPPEARGLEFIINCTARCGGVKIYQPTAMTYIDFATS